jgi:hypothetical protein
VCAELHSYVFHIFSRTRWPRGLRRKFRPSGFWDRGFESRSGYGCFVFVFLCCVVRVGRGLCDGLITRPKESCHVTNKVKRPKKGGLGPVWAVKATDDDDDDGPFLSVAFGTAYVRARITFTKCIQSPLRTFRVTGAVFSFRHNMKLINLR